MSTYSIRIKNPTTEGSKNVKGTIVIQKIGPKRRAIGSLEGFPDGGNIEFTGNPTSAASNDILITEMLLNLEQEIISKYEKQVRLETYEPEQPEPTTDPEIVPEVIDPIIEPVTENSNLEPEIANSSQVTQPVNAFTPTTNKPTAIPKTKRISYNIVEVFKKTIELDELSISANAIGPNTQRSENIATLEYPLIKINEYIFSRVELTNVTIDCTEFLPKISVSVVLTSQAFIAREMPKDGDIISIAIRNESNMLKMIRNDYVITAVHSTPNLTDTIAPVAITFYGELFIPGLKSGYNNFSFNGTSYYALQDFAKKYGLGFASNEDDTDDKQIWLKANITGDAYVKQITNSAWKDTNSFYASWIDIYYNLNFVNLNKQLISSESEVGLAALVTNIDKYTHYGADMDESKTIGTVKVFSNFTQFKSSPFFIRTWRPINRSSTITFQIGTKMICEIFEHNKNIYENPEAKKHWSIPVEPTYDNEKTNKMILLRGRPSYVNTPGNPDAKKANYSYTELYHKYPWLGVQYTISNSNESNLQWDGNHHKNYKLARVQNLINNKELEKLNVRIEVIGSNLNIIRGDKMPMALIRTNMFDNMSINPNINFNDALDLFYSGWYLVKGFTLTWSGLNNQTVFSNFTQEFILTRREWPAPIPIEPIKTQTP